MEKVTKPIVLNETFSEKLNTTNDFLSAISESCKTISADVPKVTTGTSADGSTTITVENKDGTTTTKLVDGTARASVNTLSARMDTFTSLPEGSTSGNAELADIRVGADGTTYDTAGNAVRGQIGELKSDLDKIINISPNIVDKSQIMVGMWSSNMTKITDSPNTDRTNFRCYIVECKPNETYSFKQINYNVHFYNRNGDFISPQLAVGGDGQTHDFTFTTYDNAYYFVVDFLIADISEDDFIGVKGDTLPSEYIPYGAWLNDSFSLTPTMENEVNEIIASKVIDNPTEYEGNDICIFNKGLCIGDSLTDGVFNHDETSEGFYTTRREYSYPTQLSKITGITMTNLGVGGVTSTNWWDAHKNEDLSGYDFAIIQLGVNDALKQSDGFNADSINALNNIIAKLKAENQRIKIFISTIVPARSYLADSLVQASERIRDYYNNLSDKTCIYLTDLASYGHTNDDLAYNCGHLSAYGYLTLANDYKAYISYIISNNKNDFRYVQFSNTDYTYGNN